MGTAASERDSRGARGQNRSGTRTAVIRRSRLRGLVVESLETRTLLAVIPQVSASAPIDISNSGGLVTNARNGNQTAPSVAIDPTNPQDMVAVWVTDSVQFPAPNNGQTTIFVQGAFSTNAGKSWTPFGDQTTFSGSNLDFNKSQTSGPVFFGQVTDASVAFDANHNFYVLDSPHASDYSSGEVALDKFTFAPGGAPTFVGPQGGNILYRWAQQDPVYRPTLAVDANSNSPNFPGQIDTHVNSVYVAWATNRTLTPNTAQQDPNRIELIASADGNTFSTPVLVDGASYTSIARDASPKIVVSQGRAPDPAVYGAGDPGVSPGQVTVIWDDTGTLSQASPVPLDQIASTQIVGGGGGIDFAFQSVPAPIKDATAPPSGSTVNTPAESDYDITTSNIPSNVSDLNVTIALTHNDLSQVQIVLVSPSGKRITLVRNRDNNDTSIQANPNVGISGTNLGQSASNQFLGTTFSSSAARSIFNNAGGAASVGSFVPEGGPGDTVQTLAQLLAGGANGKWELQITDEVSSGTVNPPPQLLEFNLQFTTGIQLTAATNVPIDTTTVRGAVNGGVYTTDGGGSTISPVPDVGIGPGAVIASDNTLGSFSPHEGRLYVAYTGRVAGTNIVNDPDNTDVFLAFSDDGGQSWHKLGQVNDDNATTDGYSGAGVTTVGGTTTITGRAQFQPQVAVDLATGTLVVSFLDARNDPSRDRVATYVTSSIDGGQSFSAQTFVNPTQTATDAITGQTDNLGPIPDNQSVKNPQRDTKFDFGDHQALAVFDGHVFALWSGNENGSTLGNSVLNILASQAVIASGPRIISSTMGPVQAGQAQIFNIANGTTSFVTFNSQTATDGTPIFDGFEVTFDRPVDPSTFDPSAVTITYEDTSGNKKSILASKVSPVFVAGNPNQDGHFGFETFLISLPGQTGVGTYSYTIAPKISDRIFVANVQQPTTLPTVTQTFTPSTPVAIPTSGTGGSNTNNDIATSAIALSGHGSESIGAISVDLNSLSMSAGSLGGLRIELLTSSGGDIILYQNGGDARTLFSNTTFSDSGVPISSLPSNTPYVNQLILPLQALSALKNQLVDQTYTLKITDFQSGNVGKLFTWSINVTPVNPNVGSRSGALMDQNANGTSGEAGDVYSNPALSATSGAGFFNQNTLPIIISGPRMVSTSVPGASASQPNLALNASANALDVSFDRDMQVASFTPAQILRMMGPAGQINGPFTVTPVFDASSAGTIAAGQTIDFPLTISNNGTFTIQDLRVRLDISTANESSLKVVLMGPGGKQVTLFGGVGAGPNFTGMVLDDHATTPVAQGATPFTGSFIPAQSLDAAFKGVSLTGGTWTLAITNAAGAPTATLNSWSLEATPSNSDALAREFRVGFPVQSLSGTYTVQIASSVVDDQGHALDMNQNAGLQVLRQVDTGGSTVPITYNSSDTPQGIVTTIPNNVTTSVINVTDDFPIQGITLRLNVTYPNDPQLTATLIAPDGTSVLLFSGVGATGTQANFNNTVFDESATTPIDFGGPPFASQPNSNHFKPQQNLNQLLNLSLIHI